MWRGIGVALLIVLTLGACAPPPPTVAPHENPDTAPTAFYGVSWLDKYSEGLDYLLLGDARGLGRLRDQLTWANIPPDLGDIADQFLSSGQLLSSLMTETKIDLERSRSLLSQYQLQEALQSLEEVTRKLERGYSEQTKIVRTDQRIISLVQRNAPAEGGPLPEVYQKVQTKELDARRLLGLLSETRGSLAQEAEELKGRLLRPTTLTLSVHSTVAFLGNPVEFSGTLAAPGEPLAGRRVTILLNGSPASVVLTDSGGAYQGRMVLPYQYVSEMTVQALYYPRGAYLGRFLGSSSPEVAIKVLFYPTRLSLQVPREAYPGRGLGLKGSFDYGQDPVPESRSLWAHWDGESVAEAAVAQQFTLELPIPPEESLGQHPLAIYIPAQQRYAPGSFTTEVEVIRALPIIDMAVPGIALLPFSLQVRGRAYSALGPLQDAAITVTLGDWETTLRSREDGTFHARLSTGLSLTLLGSQKLQVRVTPREPWHEVGSTAAGLVVINPVNLAGLALGVAALAFSGARRVRRRAALPGAPPPPLQPAPTLIRREEAPQIGLPQPEVRGSPRAVLLALYRALLRLLQRVTQVLLRPSHTLREFALECAPRLGPLGGYFWEFTLMIERLLYSRHPMGERETARGQELSQKLKEGFKE